MFTGIIEETGRIKDVARNSRSVVLKVEARKVLEDVHIGDSIAVNGVCLTVTSFANHIFTADVMPETVQRSGLGKLHVGDVVNLERALTLSSRLGGHLVSGHIDGTGTIRSIIKNENAILITIAASESLSKYIVEKGSVAIDGISLTVASVNESSFTVSVIPHTLNETILHAKKTGEMVNIETDIIGKYIEKFMKENTPKGLTLDFLIQNGF